MNDSHPEGLTYKRIYQTPAEHHHSENAPCRLPYCAVAFRDAMLAEARQPAPSEGPSSDIIDTLYEQEGQPAPSEKLDLALLVDVMRNENIVIAPASLVAIEAEYNRRRQPAPSEGCTCIPFMRQFEVTHQSDCALAEQAEEASRG